MEPTLVRGYRWPDVHLQKLEGTAMARAHTHEISHPTHLATRSNARHATHMNRTQNLEPIQAIDLLLCSVKKVPDPDRQDCFMLISPEIQMTLQALGPKDLDEWIYVIQEGIGFQLKKKQKDKEHTTVTDSSEKFNYLAELREISPANRVCADCDDPSTPSPTPMPTPMLAAVQRASVIVE